MACVEEEHYALLEIIPRGENSRRSSLNKNSQSAQKKRQNTLSKPMNVYKEGKFIFTCINGKDARKKFLEIEKLNTKFTYFAKYIKKEMKYMGLYTFSWIIDDNPDADFYKDEKWLLESGSTICQEDEIKRLIGHLPRDISTKGRIKDNKGRIINGWIKRTHNKTRMYHSYSVALFIHLAFSNRKIDREKGEMICHKDGKELHPEVYLKDGTYSNALGTFYIGTPDDNARDTQYCKERVAAQKPMNEFIVKKDDIEIGRYFCIPSCARELTEKYGIENIDRSCIRKCLKKIGTAKTFYGFTCEYVIPR
jgi:hypothetical protein